MTSHRSARTSLLALGLRIVWMFLGPVLLFILGALLMRRAGPSGIDVAYGLTVLLLIVVRYLDISRFEGTRGDTQPATMSDFRRYAVGLATISLAAWWFLPIVGALVL